MRHRLRAIWLMVVVGFAVGGFMPAAAQEETVEKLAIVYSCETLDCSDADGVKDPMTGATVTSFDALGAEVDSCTTNEYGQCALLIPAAEDGTYTVLAGPGFESYQLLSSTPESTGEGGDGREWTFVPTGETPSEDTAVNVVYCDDADCADPQTMDGAVVESYQAGELTDSCQVSSAPDDFDGCWLIVGADQVGFEVIPAAGFEDYVLADDEPEVYDIDREGATYQLLLWTFVPASDNGEVTPVATISPTQTPGQVAALPATGSGVTSSSISTTAVLLTGLTIAGALFLAASTVRQR